MRQVFQGLPVQGTRVLEFSLWQQEAADSLRMLQTREEARLRKMPQRLRVQVGRVLEISLRQHETTDPLRMLQARKWQTLVATVCCDPKHLADDSES